MKKLKLGGLLLSGVVACSAIGAFAGCSGGNSALAEEMFGFGDEYYRNVEQRYTLNYDEMLYDDFTGDKLDKTKWVVSDSVWDQWGTDQNGVRPQNLFLVKDETNPETHLMMRANGAYYDGDNNPISSSVNGINTGAGISTVEALGPGRYDVKMKACPRIGALTSMWLFSWFNLDNGNIQQNEIDIELGLTPNFSVASFTTWTSNSNNTSVNVPVDFYINDGDWHVYSFDWVTDAEQPYVDYYIDGELLYTATTNVPTTNATLTLGVWLPCWAGGGIADSTYNVSPESRMFETDYAEFSWWRYVPFQMGGWEQRPVENRNYDPNYQPEIITSVPVVNKCSNGNFERTDESYYYPAIRDNETAKAEIFLDTPWKDYTITDPTDSYYIEGSKVSVVEDGEDNHCAKIEKGGSYGQWLRGASDGFKFRMTGRYKTEDSATAVITLCYYESYAITASIIDSDFIQIGNATEWTEFSVEFTVSAPKAVSIMYYLENLSANGTSYFDDIRLEYIGH